MVEAPLIRMYYESLKFIIGRKILEASGTTYQRLKLDLIGFHVADGYYLGKNIYLLLKKRKQVILLRSHFMMYGRIVIGITDKKPNLQLILETGEIISWVLSQVKVVPMEEWEYQKFCCLDVSSTLFDECALYKHVRRNMNKEDILVDLLLNQTLFPGVGNIVQQEVLYKCLMSPLEICANLKKEHLMMLVRMTHITVMNMYDYFPFRKELLVIYHKAYCPQGHKTVTKRLGDRQRRVTWCEMCVVPLRG